MTNLTRAPSSELEAEKIESATLRHGCDIYTRRILELELQLAEARNKALEEAALVCDEMSDHYAAYKDTALLNGDIALSNAASGEPRACEFLSKIFRALKTPISEKTS